MNQSLSSDRARQKEIAKSLREQDLLESEAGELLLRLSPQTRIDSLEVLEEDILIEGDRFSGPVTWHVTLVFPDANGPSLVSSDTFPGIFRGHYANDAPIFDSLDVDVSSLSQRSPGDTGVKDV